MSSKLYQYSTLLALMTVATLVAPCKRYTTVVSKRDSVRQEQIDPCQFISQMIQEPALLKVTMD